MSLVKWKTKEGFEIAPNDMATPHLLSTIHMIERSRMTSLIHIAQRHNSRNIESIQQDVIDFYCKWPEAYDALLDEAERRQLIRRSNGSSKETRLIRRKKS